MDCPRYKALREEEKHTTEYKKIEEENKVCVHFMFTYRYYLIGAGYIHVSECLS